jgi:hypothetical protein
MKPSDLKPIDLTNDTKVYQFIKQTESENRTSKLALSFDKKSHAKLLKAIEKWMDWHLKSMTVILMLMISLNSFSAPNQYKKPLFEIKKKELPREIIQAISLVGVVYGGWTIHKGIENNSSKQVSNGQKILFPSFAVSVSIDIIKAKKKK